MTVKELIKELQKYPEDYIVRDECNDEIHRVILVNNGYYSFFRDYVMLKTTIKDEVLDVINPYLNEEISNTEKANIYGRENCEDYNTCKYDCECCGKALVHING